ncbi:nodulation protein NodH [Rhodovulum sp. YNF3179]|uniref:nodulation protein NodH n=1 Tax=Rhodovulum sp. YNF3179 TaxID=3425127 RepID=UPI003D337BDB
MAGRYDGFVVLAAMRTGSNLLADRLNQIEGLRCHGELFNPHFLGAPGQQAAFGVSRAAREADPMRLLAAMRAATPDALTGFRLFPDHDPRVLAALLADRRWAKIVLSRNPLESFVSRGIAAKTGQWQLTAVKTAKTARIRFDPDAFEAHLGALDDFRRHVRAVLQKTGQGAFHIHYEELGDPEVLNGLARFLGVEAQLRALSSRLKKQNPADLRECVTNPRAMERALARRDRFGLDDPPEFEPSRGPAVPRIQAGACAPFLFLPILGAPVETVVDWLARHEIAAGGASLMPAFDRKALRQWKRRHPGHRSFTVIRHPLARAHESFCRYILARGPGTYGAIRERLANHHGLALPEDPAEAAYDAAAHRAALLGFLGFVKRNLSAQTGLRTDPAWASQTALVQGFAAAAPPDLVIREERLAASLAYLEEMTDRPHLPVAGAPPPPVAPVTLADIYDTRLEAAARAAYQRDYMMFGFGAWAPPG